MLDGCGRGCCAGRRARGLEVCRYDVARARAASPQPPRPRLSRCSDRRRVQDSPASVEGFGRAERSAAPLAAAARKDLAQEPGRVDVAQGRVGAQGGEARRDPERPRGRLAVGVERHEVVAPGRPAPGAAHVVEVHEHEAVARDDEVGRLEVAHGEARPAQARGQRHGVDGQGPRARPVGRRQRLLQRRARHEAGERHRAPARGRPAERLRGQEAGRAQAARGAVGARGTRAEEDPAHALPQGHRAVLLGHHVAARPGDARDPAPCGLAQDGRPGGRVVQGEQPAQVGGRDHGASPLRP
ncbi:MAG: hypothetical protein KF878_09010 [Planctomycetes bacterium]|nr:hypothetical protein [Planctomycetota bacterium]